MPAAPEEADARSRGAQRAETVRFLAGLAGLFGALVALMGVLKLLFVAANWAALLGTDGRTLAWAWFYGLRFAAAAAAMLLVPVAVAWYLLLVVKARPLRWCVCGYVSLLAFVVPAVAISDLQYFEDSGKHFTYEFLAYFGAAGLPPILGAFTLHPWLLSLALVGCLGSSVAAGFAARRLVASCIPRHPSRRRTWLLTLLIAAGLAVLAIRGAGRFQLDLGDAVISPNPYVNAVCLDPVFAVLRTAFSPERPYQFRTEAENVVTTRALLGCDGAAPLDPRYPLLRESPGTPQGNRLNVILFLLESWSGDDIGCLGGETGITPVFDELATQGTLFPHAYATGVRTAEGAVSILCSFPNQPLRPVLNRPAAFQNHWRSLSQILAAAGYRNIFVHGRDVDFDHLRDFLRAIGFHKIISREDFPMSFSITRGAWRGHHDEDVMRRAAEEFAAVDGQPFFGLIYTMNTHPPFATPDRFPLVRPPDSDANRYLNALHYSDYTLGVLLELARAQPYFQNTIFIFVADHARTRGRFNLSSQHHIPLLIYAPGHVPAGINLAVASQTDILPTVLGLLQLRTRHAAWGRDLRTLSADEGLAVCVAGNEVRWHDRLHLLDGGLSEARPLLFDLVRDPTCTRDVWTQDPQTGAALTLKLRSYLALSQTLLYDNRVAP
jgi:hypothetical protein